MYLDDVILTSKKRYNSEKLRESQHSSNVIWYIINNHAKNKPVRSTISETIYNNKPINSNKSIANELNHYFLEASLKFLITPMYYLLLQ